MKIIRTLLSLLLAFSLAIPFVAPAQTISGAGSSTNATVPRAPAMRQCGSRSAVPRGSLTGAGRWIMAASVFYWRCEDQTRPIRLCWWIGSVSGSNAEASYTNVTLKTSVSLNGGARIQADEEIANGGNGISNGSTPVVCRTYQAYPKRGDKLTSYTLLTGDGGVPYTLYADSFNSGAKIPGEGFENGTGTPGDKVMSGTVNADSFHFAAIEVLGWTTQPAIAITGDSIVEGDDRDFDQLGERGLLTPTVGRRFGYSSFAIAGTSASQWLGTTHTVRDSIINSGAFTHFVDEYGINDFFGGQSVAQVQTSRQSMRALYPSLVAIQTTLLPQTASTDGWVTTANQNPGTVGAKVLQLNELVHTGQTGADFYWDTADIFDPGRTGKWSVSRNPWATSSPKTVQFTASIASSGVMTVSAVTTGTLAVGDCPLSTLTAAGAWNTDVATSTYISSLGTGTGTTGTYNTLPAGQTVTSRTMYAGSCITADGTHPERAARDIIRNSGEINLDFVQ
jgi:hypothetical protein